MIIHEVAEAAEAGVNRKRDEQHKASASTRPRLASLPRRILEMRRSGRDFQISFIESRSSRKTADPLRTSVAIPLLHRTPSGRFGNCGLPRVAQPPATLERTRANNPLGNDVTSLASVW
jgi:hypothetical protein